MEATEVPMMKPGVPSMLFWRVCKCVQGCIVLSYFSKAPHLTPVAGSIFGPLSQTHFSKRVFMNEISSSALHDIQLTLLCVCGVGSFLPESEHL